MICQGVYCRTTYFWLDAFDAQLRLGGGSASGRHLLELQLQGVTEVGLVADAIFASLAHDQAEQVASGNY